MAGTSQENRAASYSAFLLITQETASRAFRQLYGQFALERARFPACSRLPSPTMRSREPFIVLLT